MTDFSIDGADDLIARLDYIGKDMKLKGGRAALRKAALFLAGKIQENAKRIDDPATAEDISKNVTIRWSPKTFKRTGDLPFRVGILGGARQYGNTRENVRKRRAGATYQTLGDKSNPGGDTWYWRLVEFGTRRSKAQPFMRPAIKENAGAVIDVFVRQYDKTLDNAVLRAVRKAR